MPYMGLLKKSTAVNKTILMIDSADHITGKTGLAAGITKYITKAAGTPAATTITTSELDATNVKGVYKLAFADSDVDTLGDFQLHLTATGADPADYWWTVNSFLPGDSDELNSISLINSYLDVAISSRLASASYTAPDNTNIGLIKAKTDKLTFDSDNFVESHPMTGVVVTTNNDKTGYALTSAYDPAKTASQDSDMAVVLVNVIPLTFDSDNYVLSHPMTSIVTTLDSDLVNEINVTYTQSLKMTFDSDLYIVADSRKISASATAADNVETNIPNLDDAISNVPTANENAIAFLKYDMSLIAGEASRSPINALRFIRNKFSTTATPGVVTIYKEDDTTSAYTKSITTDSDANPIVVG